METIITFFGQTELQAVLSALFVQAIIGTFVWLVQRRPRIIYTQTNNKHFLVPHQQPEEARLPLEHEVEDRSHAQNRHESNTTNARSPTVRQDTDQPPQSGIISVYVADYTIMNVGRLAAKNVEVVFNYAPGHYDRYPHLPVRERTLQDGRYILTIDMLNPKEQISISLLNVYTELPDLTLVRCEGYGANAVRSVPMRIYPWWLNLGMVALIFVGLFSLLYFASLYFISLL